MRTCIFPGYDATLVQLVAEYTKCQHLGRVDWVRECEFHILEHIRWLLVARRFGKNPTSYQWIGDAKLTVKFDQQFRGNVRERL